MESRGSQAFTKMHEKIRRCVSLRRLRSSRPLGSTGHFLHDNVIVPIPNDDVDTAKKSSFLPVVAA